MSSNKIIALLFFFVSFGLYLFTLFPTVNFIDAGELVVVSNTLGIAHPTGYPLYTILGRLWSLELLGSRAIAGNIFSAFFASMGIFFFFLLSSRVYEHFLRGRETGDKGRHLYPPSSITRYLSSAIATLSLTLSTTLWESATSIEVYTLTFFLINLLLWILWEIKSKVTDYKLLFLCFYIYGVSFGNHLSIVLLAPAFLYFLIIEQRWIFSIKNIKRNFKFYIASILLFIIGLSIYVYLPVRASCDPIFNWGNPTSISRFISHTSAWQYRVWMFSQSFEQVLSKITNVFKLIETQYTYGLIPLIFIGLIFGLYKNFKLLLFFIILLLSNVFYAINYDIPDIDAYYLPTYITLSIFIGMGSAEIIVISYRVIKSLSQLSIINHKLSIVISYCLSVIVLFLLISLQLKRNFSNNNYSENYYAYDYADNVGKSISNDDMIITNNWDLYSPLLYLKYIENKYPNIVMIDKELLRRSWYFRYLEKEYPFLTSSSKNEIDSFLELLKTFESNKLKDPNEIQRRYVTMVNSFIKKSYKSRNIHTSYQALESGMDAGFTKIPVGCLYHLCRDSDTTCTKEIPFVFERYNIRGLDKKIDERTEIVKKQYISFAVESGERLIQRNKFNEALQFFQFASKLTQNNPDIRITEAFCYYSLGQFDTAKNILQEIEMMNPNNEMTKQKVLILKNLLYTEK